MQERIDKTILELCRARGTGKTICPSEAARALAGPDGDWRALMPVVWQAAADLADHGAIVVMQKGKPVDARTARGPIRLQLAQGAIC